MSKQRAMEFSFSKLPHELHLRILSQLPLTNLLPVRAVCSYLYTLVGYSLIYISAYGHPPKDFLNTLRAQNITWEEIYLFRKRCSHISWSVAWLERPSEVYEKVNLLREEGMTAYESAASVASSGGGLSRERLVAAQLLFALFYHTNAQLYSIMSDAKGAPKQFSEQWLALFNETCNSRPAALLAHGQMLREQYQPSGEAHATLKMMLDHEAPLADLYAKFHPEGFSSSSEASPKITSLTDLPPVSFAVRTRILARALSSHPSLCAHVRALRLGEFRLSAERSDSPQLIDPTEAKAQRVLDFRLIRKLMSRCIALCKRQSDSPLNDRPLHDLMGTASMELAHITARENSKALRDDPDARVFLEEAKNHFSQLDRNDPYRAYNLACWHALMQHPEECKKYLEALVPLANTAETAEIFFRSLTDPDLSFARQQPWWKKLRNQLIVKLSGITV